MSSGERRREEASANDDRVSRQRFLGRVGLVGVGLSLGVPAAMGVRSVVPNVLYEPPRRVKLGPLERFADGGTFVPDQRLFVFRDGPTLHCISAICTHLGCTVQMARMPQVAGGFEFHCPCHGSKFQADGTNVTGPAPQPLQYYSLELAPDDGQLLVDLGREVDKGWRLSVTS